MKYIIIQVCCFGCNEFIDIHFANDYLKYIKDEIEDYSEYSYYIYSNDNFLYKFNFFENETIFY